MNKLIQSELKNINDVLKNSHEQKKRFVIELQNNYSDKCLMNSIILHLQDTFMYITIEKNVYTKKYQLYASY